MSWSTPKEDWAVGEVLTSAAMNAIGGNLSALRLAIVGDNYNGGAVSVTSTSYVLPDSAFSGNLTVEIGDKVLIWAGMQIRGISPAANAFITDAYEGSTGLSAAAEIGRHYMVDTNSRATVVTAYIHTATAAGVKSYSVRCKVSGGQVNILSGGWFYAIRLGNF